MSQNVVNVNEKLGGGRRYDDVDIQRTDSIIGSTT